MALTKEKTIYRSEIVGEYHTLQVIERTTVRDDDEIIAEHNHMRVIAPLEIEGGEFVDQDMSAESDYVQAVAAAAWTDEAKENYRAMMASLPHLQT